MKSDFIEKYGTLGVHTKSILYPKTHTTIKTIQRLIVGLGICGCSAIGVDAIRDSSLHERQLEIIFHNGLVGAKIWNCIAGKNSNLHIYPEPRNGIIRYECNTGIVISEYDLTESQITSRKFPSGTRFVSPSMEGTIEKIPSE